MWGSEKGNCHGCYILLHVNCSILLLVFRACVRIFTHMPPVLPITLAAGVPQYLTLNVIANSVQADGSNPGAQDHTTPLTFVGGQGFGTVVTAIEDGLASDGKRIVKLTPGVVASPSPFAFSIRAAGRTATVAINGTTNQPPDVSGVFSDGTPPSTTRPT